MMRMLVLGVCLVGATVPSLAGGDADVIATAKKYLDVYQRLEIDALEGMYLADAKFVDPTSENTPVLPPFVHEGRDNILAAFREVVASYDSLRYEIEREYESSGYVVFTGNMVATVRRPDGTRQSFGAPIVTIVKVQDGKIAEHRDYYDYSGMEALPATE